MSDASKLSALPCGRVSKWVVLGIWIVIFAVAFPMYGKLTGVQKNDAVEWLPKKAESTLVFNQGAAFVSKNTFPAIVVYDRGGGTTSQADLTAAGGDAKRMATVRHTDKKGTVDAFVESVQGPFPAKDGKALQTIVQVNIGTKGWDVLPALVKDIRKQIRHEPGATVRITGPAGYAASFGDAFSSGSSLLAVTALIVLVILLATYRSPVLWVLPLFCVFVALIAATAIVYLLAKNGTLTVNGQSAFILPVLVFGASTDYALLLVARYREELRNHEDRHVAMAVALHRAGPAILASAATVAVSLLCLLFAELQSTKSLGPVLAIGVISGLAAMLTLMPALLVICGRWMFWPVRPSYGTAQPTDTGMWARIGRRIAVRPRITWVVTAMVLGVMALGLTGLKADGLSNHDGFWGKPEAAIGEEVQARHFAAGSGSPIQVIGKAPGGPDMARVLAATQGVTDVKQPVVKNGLAYVEGTLNAVPDSQSAFDTVDKVRAEEHKLAGADAKVGGGSAFTLDIKRAAGHDTDLVVPIVLLVVFGILAIVLRALVAPLILVGTVVLSFGAALGVSALTFDHVFGFAGADPSFPLWAFVFLVALGVDYNIFLMTRVHEETKQLGTRRGALVGLAATGGVITSAGAVLAGTFGALGSLPLVFSTEIGFAVAFGVLLDTFVVRSVLVTALNLDVGRWMWWPSRLAQREDVPLEDLQPEEARS
jgi:RND superfamily putative drug exporter